jgi:glyoxylase-like metal-dependent hydrolase (beta-lactamase superfamily II)
VIGEQIRPGLWRWVAYHEEWKEEVGSAALLGADERPILIDPLLPAGGADRLSSDLRGPPHVLITIYYHARSTAEIAERMPGARVWAPRRAAAAVRRRSPVTDLFRPGDPLPGGIEAFPTVRSSEVVFWLPAQRALVPGDVLLGSEGGGLRLCPASWLPSGRTQEELGESLRPLLELPVEVVLVSHGEPVLAGGREALAEALRS